MLESPELDPMYTGVEVHAVHGGGTLEQGRGCN